MPLINCISHKKWNRCRELNSTINKKVVLEDKQNGSRAEFHALNPLNLKYNYHQISCIFCENTQIRLADYLILGENDDSLFVIELKGSDYHSAQEQILNVFKNVHSYITGVIKKQFACIVLSNSPKKNITNSVSNFKKKLKNKKITLIDNLNSYKIKRGVKIYNNILSVDLNKGCVVNLI